MSSASSQPVDKKNLKLGRTHAAKTGEGFLGSSTLSKSDDDEQKATASYARLARIVLIQTIIIAILSGLFLFAMPFFMPIYNYYARNPKSEVMQLVPLNVPNLTNRAILSWSTNSVTEIMTLGFGDFEAKLAEQKSRFTPEGWDAFRLAFEKQKIGEAFKESQLVLTTVPSNTPVIVAQGVNEKRIYEWRVQMPVIMTYTTNNNVKRPEKAIIELKIVRVSPEKNPYGIGIDAWFIKN